MPLTRRQFIGSAAATGFALRGAPFVLGAPKARMYRTALIGSGWWGMNILSEAVRAGQSKVVALCDVDESQLETSLDELSTLTSDEPRTYRDYRELFDQEDVEIAIVATPDHWHALPTIAALQKGAHVYVEKPLGHTIGESQAIVSAARQSDRIVQVGMHRRIGPHHVSGMEFLKSGRVGDIGMVRMFVHGTGGPETPTPNREPPKGLDWDLYCGPAPLRSFSRRIHPGGFRGFLDFANGTLGDWGVHWLDQVLWWTDEKAPHTVYSTGGRPIKGEPVLNEQSQTTDAPDTQIVVYGFDDFTAVWEHRQYAGNETERHKIGAYFYGTNGIFHMGWRDGWTFYPTGSKGGTSPVHEDPQFDNEPDGHNIKLLWADFLQAIASGSKPVANVEVGHQATVMALLGMASLKAGRSLDWNADQEQIVGDSQAQALLRREYRTPWVYPLA